ncbi:MAG TPA: aldo/keto reductase, partial [Kineosporiaceae bacterium]
MPDCASRTPSSRIALGTSRLRSAGGGLDQAQAVRFVQAAFDLGVTTFDTANIYGQGDAERALGVALASRRDSVCLSTKVGYEMPAVVSGARALKPFVRMMATRLPIVRRASQALRGRAGNGRVEDVGALTVAARESLARLRTDHVDVLYLHSPERVTEPLVAFLSDAVSSGLCRKAGVAVADVDVAREWARTGV